MTRPLRSVLDVLLLLAGLTYRATGQVAPDTIAVTTAGHTLRALLWRPAGGGAHPAVLFNHGRYPSGSSPQALEYIGLGPVFAARGYAFLLLFRPGVGLSATEGIHAGERMAQAEAEGGSEARNRVQLELMDAELADVRAALAVLRSQPDVDPHRIAVVGHSFGGSLTLLLAARESSIRAGVVFGAAAASWAPSPSLQSRLRQAVAQTAVPVFFIHAANDYSVTPGQVLAGEMRRLGKPYQLKIYPAQGRSSSEGHSMVFRNVAVWSSDVFEFLGRVMRP